MKLLAQHQASSICAPKNLNSEMGHFPNLSLAKWLQQKDGEKGLSAIAEVETKEYTANNHKRTQGVGFKKGAPQALKEIWKFAMREIGAPDVCSDTSFNKAAEAKGIRNVPHCVGVWLSRKHNEDEGSPNKLCTLVTYVPVTTFRNLQSIWMRTNH
ncbi:60S ribosomal protein L31 [Camelus dromedarius]|uniref:Large ribosomal subunit protein eL31 n=1 Tax=Camelus dromedarius TaxID=9838 RepID=A0A5N4E1K0_CAMDR|nr:60S ribosomal protein L31 [Camelus dromedarius]